jgi:hypothetical protein
MRLLNIILCLALRPISGLAVRFPELSTSAHAPPMTHCKAPGAGAITCVTLQALAHLLRGSGRLVCPGRAPKPRGTVTRHTRNLLLDSRGTVDGEATHRAPGCSGSHSSALTLADAPALSTCRWAIENGPSMARPIAALLSPAQATSVSTDPDDGSASSGTMPGLAVRSRAALRHPALR